MSKLGGILSERQTDIDMIHSHAGLVLHAAGETVSKREAAARNAWTRDLLAERIFICRRKMFC